MFGELVDLSAKRYHWSRVSIRGAHLHIDRSLQSNGRV